MATFFPLWRPHGMRTTAGAAHIAPYNLFSSACLTVILWRVSLSLNRTEPGIPPWTHILRTEDEIMDAASLYTPQLKES
jgi:hypothetical protein